MAHNKVFGICESKCMVEVSEKGKEFVINAVNDFITRYKCEELNATYFVTVNLSEHSGNCVDKGDYYLLRFYLDERHNNLFKFINDLDKNVTLKIINNTHGSNVYCVNSDIQFNYSFLTDSESTDFTDISVGRTVYFGFAQTKYKCNRNQAESLITLEYDKPHQKFFKTTNNIQLVAPFNCSVYICMKIYNTDSSGLHTEQKSVCKYYTLYTNESVDLDTDGDFFEIDIYINGYNSGEF